MLSALFVVKNLLSPLLWFFENLLQPPRNGLPRVAGASLLAPCSKSKSHEYGEQGCSPYLEEDDGLSHELRRMAEAAASGATVLPSIPVSCFIHLPLRLECRRCMQRQTGVRQIFFNPVDPVNPVQKIPCRRETVHSGDGAGRGT